MNFLHPEFLYLAPLAAALDELEPGERERIRVVMASVDPGRDTAERLRTWLAAFDRSFVGVRGSEEAVDQALAFYGYPPTEFEELEEGGYLVGHPAYIYAFTPDDWGRAMYPAGTTKEAWLQDLRVLLGREWEGERGVGALTEESPEPEPPLGRPVRDSQVGPHPERRSAIGRLVSWRPDRYPRRYLAVLFLLRT